jgi:hypothetical protein
MIGPFNLFNSKTILISNYIFFESLNSALKWLKKQRLFLIINRAITVTFHFHFQTNNFKELPTTISQVAKRALINNKVNYK